MPGINSLASPYSRLVPASISDKHADAADQMLVDGVVMIEIELHHRDDVAELRHEFSEHARFVHAPEHDLGGVFRAENFAKKLDSPPCPRAIPRR